MSTEFDDIRPYLESEVGPAMRRIAASPYLGSMASFVFPGRPLDEVRGMVDGITTTDGFQSKVMAVLNEQVIAQTMSSFSVSGLENIVPESPRLVISNHRDIVLDSSLFQQVLHRNGMKTTEITFGSNLMSSQLVIDIGRSNKMFKVIRGENPRDFYKTSLHLSKYIRHALTQKRESVWIAQRNGRTKDGNDATDQGIVKMFCMSDNSDLARSVEELCIVPVSISYQWEPCDFFKTRELYMSRDGATYVKQKDEDFISVITGITQFKGDAHLSISQPLTIDELLAAGEGNAFYRNVASLIDSRIRQNYKLFDTNYIAHDLLRGAETYASHYTTQAKQAFCDRLAKTLADIEGDKDAISVIFLGIYANPVENKLPRINGSDKK